MHSKTPLLFLSYNNLLAENETGWLSAGWEIPQSYVQTNSDGTSVSLFLNGARHDLVAADGCYHTKIETHLKIEKKTGATNEKGEFWTVYDTNGTEYRFGANPDSENMLNTSDPAVAPYVWRWSLDRITDTNGNSIYYSYSEETGAVYLSRIEYNNDRQRAIAFELEDRPDPYTTVDEGSEISMTKRLSRINISVSGNTVKSFKLDYAPITPETPLSLLASITKYGSDGVTALPPTRFTYKAVAGPAWLLETITEDMGGSTTVSYISSDVDFPATFPDTYWLVSSITRDNGLPLENPQHTTATTGFTYTQGLYDIPSAEFRGFGQVTETRSDGTKVIHSYHQDDAKKGKEAQTLVTDAAGNPYAATVKSWSATAANGVHTVNLDRVESFTYDGRLDNPKQEVTGYEYDAYGNVTLETRYGDAAVSGDETYTRREYAYNTDKWIVDKVKHTAVSLSSGGAKVRESWFAYDGAASPDTAPTIGNLTREENLLDSGENPVTSYRYDSYGNRTGTTDPEGRVTTVDYDSDFHTFPVKVTNAKGQVTERQFNPANGKPTLDKDPNGAETRYSYDLFQRLVKVIKPGDSDSYPTTEISYNLDGTAPESVTVKARKQAGAAATLDTIQSVDGFGRVIQTKSAYQDPAYKVAVDTFYDSMGRDARHSLPYLSYPSPDYSLPLSALTAVTDYDPIGRPVKVTNPDSTFLLRSYDHWTVMETDENGRQKQKSFDANEKLVQVAEFNGADTYLTRYTYNPLGELVQTINHLGNTTSHSYDSLGRKTKVVDQDLGVRTAGYDKAGNVIAQTDGRGRTTRYRYDDLNRVTLVDYPNDQDIAYVYDEGKIGTLSRVTDAVGTVSYGYDARLRKTSETRTMDGRSWTTGWVYDPLDWVVSQTYPDNQTTTFSYNDMGRLAGISGILSAIDYNHAWLETRRDYSNGLATTFDYYPEDQRLKRILTTGVQDFNYEYDNVGNMKKIVNATQPAATRTETFTYDPLDRLQIAEDPGSGGYRKDYVYNAIGNMLTETSVQSGATSVAQYTYGQGGAGPHAVTGKTDQKPIIALFSLNGGQPYATTLQVSLTNVTIGNPTEFMASEAADFAGASWQSYGAGISFTLSSSLGKKTVYFKVRKNGIESAFKIAEIEYQPDDADSDGIPDKYDTDNNNDGFPETWANRYFSVGTVVDPLADPDGDGWNNLREYQLGTNPTMADNPYQDSQSASYLLKRASFSAAGEVRQSGNYTLRDSLQQVGFNQGGGQRESANYVISDAFGRQTGYLGLLDTDGDGIPDIIDDDDDNDGMPDWWEIAHGLNPLDPADAQADPDGDGLINLQEYLKGTNPHLADSDHDGLNDYREVYVFHTQANGNDPARSADSDGDGLPDAIDPEPANYNPYGSSESYTIRHGNFSAGSARRESETLVVNDRLGNGEAGVALIVNSGVYITPTRVDFGTYAGGGAPVQVTVTNAGSGSVTLGSLTATGANPYEFIIGADGCSGINLAPATTCTFDLQFTPSYSGAKSATVEISTSDTNTPLVTASLAGIAAGMSDNQPPAGSVIVNNGLTATSNSGVTLTLNAQDASGVVQMCISNDNVCAGWEPYQQSRSWNLPNGDGAKTIHVWYRDSLGNANFTPLTATITLDTQSPAVIPSVPGGIYNTAQLVTLTANEQAIIYYTLNGTNPTTGSSIYGSPLSLSGNTVLKFIAFDQAGNASVVQTEQYVINATAPLLTVSSPTAGTWTNMANVTLRGRVTDGLRLNRFTVNGTDVSLAYDGSFAHPLTLSAGLNQISSLAVDEASNQATDSRQIGLDQQAPSIVIDLPAAAEIVYGPSYLIQGSAVDSGGSGLQRVEISLDGGQNWVVASGTTSWSYSWAVPPPGSFTLKARVLDAAGNMGYAAERSITVSVRYRLDILFDGTGSGTVNSDPTGISCASGPCSASFPSGSRVDLFATPASSSLFGGWSNGCSGTGTCTISPLTADTGVTANFTSNAKLKLSGSQTTHASLQDAYNSANDGESFLMQVYSFIESLYFNQPKQVKLYGGMDPSYSTTIGVTTISGSLTIEQGSVEISNVVIR